MSPEPSNTADLETNPLTLFSNRGESYEKYRPIHPASAVDAILSDLNTSTQLVAADIGAGTGIGSRLLGDRGVQVWAIEPNADMRASATPHDNVKFISGTAENIPLEPASVDLVVSFQAFHWFDFTKSLHEFHRILKLGGRLALVWSLWDDRDVITRQYTRLIAKASKHQKCQAPAQMRAKKLLGGIRYQLFWQGVHLPYFRNFHRYWFSFDQCLNLTGLVGLAQSQGFVACEGEAFEDLIAGLSELHTHFRNEHDQVRLVYRTRLYLANS